MQGKISSEAHWQDEAYMACIGDILENPAFYLMDRYIQHGKTTCMEHCIQVSWLSWRIACMLGGDRTSAARAGLLHDFFLYDWHTHARDTGEHFHGVTHPRTALLNARKYFTLTAAEEEIILRHMWPLTPLPPLSRAGLSVVIADKIRSVAEVMEALKGRAGSRSRLVAAGGYPKG